MAGPQPGNEFGFLCCSLEVKFFLIFEISVFDLKAYSRLKEAHPHDGVGGGRVIGFTQSLLIRMLITSKSVASPMAQLVKKPPEMQET